MVAGYWSGDSGNFSSYSVVTKPKKKKRGEKAYLDENGMAN